MSSRSRIIVSILLLASLVLAGPAYADTPVGQPDALQEGEAPALQAGSGAEAPDDAAGEDDFAAPAEDLAFAEDSAAEQDGYGASGSLADAARVDSPGAEGCQQALAEENEESRAAADEASLPERFDAREQGWIGSFVRQQNPWGSCWAISALEAMEANLVKQGSIGVDESLSPRHLLMFAGAALPEAGAAVVEGTGVQAGQVAAQAGEGQHPVDWLVANYGSNAPFELGGNFYVVYQSVASGVGPVLESSAPYRNNEGLVEYGQDASWYAPEGTWTLPEALRFASVVQLNEAISLASPAQYDSTRGTESYRFDVKAFEAAKRAIVEYGSLAIAMDSSSEYYDKMNGTVFTSDSRRDNHGVQIVGWDDAISRALFTTGAEGMLPEGDGAWIVRNSWGAPDQAFPNESSWSSDGYFYLSYYDRSAQAFSAYDVSLAGKPGTTDIINQHDFFGQMGQVSARVADESPNFLSANVFTAECDQKLEAVSVDTYEPGSVVTIEVYLLDEGATLPDQGRLLERLQTTIDHAGYHRVQLKGSHELAQGQRFAIVERVLEPTADGSVSVATIEAGNSKQAAALYGYYHYDTLVVNAGESFLFTSLDDTQAPRWMDAVEVGAALTSRSKVATPYGNVCIKAFSRKLAGPQPQPTPTPTPSPDPSPAPHVDPSDARASGITASDAPAKTVQGSAAAYATPATGDEAPVLAIVFLLAGAAMGLAVAGRRLRAGN